MNAVTQLKPVMKRRLDIVTITPEKAMELLELNTLNRPLDQQHVFRIMRQIKEGKWRFNGDTIKIADGGDIVDGQHRLWAIVEAKMPAETVIVHGVPRSAFATIDTLSKPRGGRDILALNGVAKYRQQASGALVWLIRWQRNIMTEYRVPKNRIENSDIEEAYAHHPGIVAAAERTTYAVRGLASAQTFTFLYYIMSTRNQEIADRMLDTLENPSGVSIHDPFFQLRSYLASDKHKLGRQAEVVMALAIKAANAAKADEKIGKLHWRNQGEKREAFPKLKI